MKIKQLSVFLENKPGALSAPCRLLAKARINIQTCSLADTREFGILRLVVEDTDKARRLLERNGFAVKVTDVIALEVADQPGGLAAILDALEGTGINVEYAYSLTGRTKGGTRCCCSGSANRTRRCRCSRNGTSTPSAARNSPDG